MDNNIFLKMKEGKGKYQVVCFPYLGGYANAFCDLVDNLNNDFEVWVANPPGHGGSKLELKQDINALVDLYFEELKPIIKSNCIFFGHSMGGIVSYFVTQRIFESPDYKYKPKALILSACGTPDKFAKKKISTWSDEKLLNKLISYGGMPEEVLKEKNLLSYLLPVFRADYKVLESSANCTYMPLNIPVHLIWGQKDKFEPLEDVLQWKKYFTNSIKMKTIKNGEHMFIHDKVIMVGKYIESIVRSNKEDNNKEYDNITIRGK